MSQLNTVWIVDDDPIFTYGLKKLITITDFCKNISTFNNGEEALNFLKLKVDSSQSLPDVILLDLNMPIMDGWQFLDAFVELTLVKNIRIYIASSSIDVVDHLKARDYTVVSDFLVKPLKRSDLQMIMEDCDAE